MTQLEKIIIFFLLNSWTTWLPYLQDAAQFYHLDEGNETWKTYCDESGLPVARGERSLNRFSLVELIVIIILFCLSVSFFKSTQDTAIRSSSSSVENRIMTHSSTYM